LLGRGLVGLEIEWENLACEIGEDLDFEFEEDLDFESESEIEREDLGFVIELWG
jgi:hypothetical protein